jgi:uncharacterized protein involved in exopolysaccharide biosynthesis
MLMDKEPHQRFEFPIPFDPFRLLLAVLERWKEIAFCTLAMAAAAALFAFFVLGDTYTARLELIKRTASEAAETDITKPYAARPLDDEALMIAGYAKEVFDLASATLGGNPSGEGVKGSITLEPVGSGGLFALKARSKAGLDEAYALGYAYANSLIAHTANIRKREALDQSELLAKQLAIKKAEIERMNSELLAFAEENSFFSEKEQGASLYAALEQLKQKAQEAKISLNSKSALIQNATRELEGPGYLRQLIAKKQEELDTLRESAKELNPTVKRAVAEIQEMKNQLATLELQGIGGANTERPTIPRGNNDGALTSTIIRLEEERKYEQDLLDDYEEQIAAKEKEIETLPEKMLTVTNLKQNLDELQRTAAQMENRLGETRFHAESAPGVLKIFQNISPSDVEHRSRLFKAALLGIAGLFLGAFVAVAFTFALEFFRRTVRTPVQAAIATGTSPILRYDAVTGQNGGGLRGFWMRRIARFAPEGRRFLFAVLGEIQAEEKFWSDLFDVVGADDHRVIFMDFSENPLHPLHGGETLPVYDPQDPALVSMLSPTGHSPESFRRMLSGMPERHLLLVRWDSSDSSWLTTFGNLFDRHYFLTSTRDALLEEVEAQALNYREVLGAADGTILIDRERPKLGTRFLGSVEDWFIDMRQNRKSPTPQPAI